MICLISEGTMHVALLHRYLIWEITHCVCSKSEALNIHITWIMSVDTFLPPGIDTSCVETRDAIPKSSGHADI